jgi:hypothetical protein
VRGTPRRPNAQHPTPPKRGRRFVSFATFCSKSPFLCAFGVLGVCPRLVLAVGRPLFKNSKSSLFPLLPSVQNPLFFVRTAFAAFTPHLVWPFAARISKTQNPFVSFAAFCSNFLFATAGEIRLFLSLFSRERGRRRP